LPGTVSAPGLFTFFVATAVSLLPPLVGELNTINNDHSPSSYNKVNPVNPFVF
jgi:hypothetical protein